MRAKDGWERGKCKSRNCMGEAHCRRCGAARGRSMVIRGWLAFHGDEQQNPVEAPAAYEQEEQQDGPGALW